MTDSRDEADRFAAGTGRREEERAEDECMRPGVEGGGAAYLPETGRAARDGTPASHAEGTVGAVGEMGFTGAPAGPEGGTGPSDGGQG